MILPRMMSEEQRRCILAWRRGFQGRDVEGRRQEYRVQTVPLQVGMSSASVNPQYWSLIGSQASFLQELWLVQIEELRTGQVAGSWTDRNHLVEASHQKKVNRDCQRALQPSKQGHTNWEGARRPNVLVQLTMEHGIPFHASGDWPRGLNKCAIANALARLWMARLPDFTCRSQPAARFCLFGGVMQHPTTKPRQLRRSAGHSAAGHWRRACPLDQKQKFHMHRFLGETRHGNLGIL
jgi:hypothetical protein